MLHKSQGWSAGTTVLNIVGKHPGSSETRLGDTMCLSYFSVSVIKNALAKVTEGIKGLFWFTVPEGSNPSKLEKYDGRSLRLAYHACQLSEIRERAGSGPELQNLKAYPKRPASKGFTTFPSSATSWGQCSDTRPYGDISHSERLLKGGDVEINTLPGSKQWFMDPRQDFHLHRFLGAESLSYEVR